MKLCQKVNCNPTKLNYIKIKKQFLYSVFKNKSFESQTIFTVKTKYFDYIFRGKQVMIQFKLRLVERNAHYSIIFFSKLILK